MITYQLDVESGPKKRKTMVHVPALLGCMANGPTTEAALEATPAAIRTYLAFLRDHGEMADLSAPFEVEVAEHAIATAPMVGSGTPYVNFKSDLVPVEADEAETALRRFRWMRETLATWAGDGDLDAGGEIGRANRAILLHILRPVGSYLAAALGGAPGFSSLATAAEKGNLPIDAALLEIAALAEERVRTATPDQFAAVVHRKQDVRTMRKALRRMLEHDWEHLVELARRPGGPQLSGLDYSS